MQKVISTERVPIKLWLNDIEGGALTQAKNLANLPFVFKHVAIMPDSHRGYGMPIGGVMATENIIVPNAVGKDIGCFSGDTKVLLLNGEQKTFRELIKDKKDIYVYSLDKRLKLVPGKATPRLTRENAELLEVMISGGEKIKCTPDHQFMMLDGSYKEAKNLKIFDSLMPLYRSYQSRDGYERIRTKSGNGIITHKMVAEYFLGEKETTDIVHHKDENWFNNNPDNLEYKDAKLHSREHRKSNPIFGAVEFVKKRLLKLRKNGFYDKRFIKKKKIVALQNIGNYNRSDKKKEQDKLAGKRGREYLIKYNKSERGRRKSSKNGKTYGFGKNANNHKVLSIRKLNKREDVYCLTVTKYHNFALSAGVFVHNCGLCAVKTSLTNIDIETLKKIMGEIRKVIPLGFKHHKQSQDIRLMPGVLNLEDDKDKTTKGDFDATKPYNIDKYPIVGQEFNSALKQIGTLGGGNHFIEIQKGSDGHIWIMIHSGSRNIGLKTATFYNNLAIELNNKWHSKIPEKWELAFLPADSEEGQNYLNEMKYCVDFALANRKLMMNRIKDIFAEVTQCGFIEMDSNLGQTLPVKDEGMINIAHNYASLENHFNKNVWVHRKGATLARDGTIGIIPGSMGSKSYIIKGLGNKDSFESCSHGAGRKMGRTQAKKTLNLEEEQEKMGTILGKPRGIQNLDEAPGAYKDIDTVMDNQKDLVEVLVELTPLANIKG